MFSVLKKYTWVFKLGAVALVALLTAMTVNDFVASKLFSVPKGPAVQQAATASKTATALGRVAAMEDATGTLRDRRIFSLNVEDEDEGAAKEEEKPKEDEKEEPKEEPKGELDESTLGIQLVGTVVSPIPEDSLAYMTVEGETQAGWVGRELLEGKAKVIRIEPRHVVLQEDSKFTVLKLWGDKVAAAPKGRSGLRATSRPGLVPKNGLRSKKATPKKPIAPTNRRKTFQDGIKKTGAYDYQIDRKMIDEQLKDLGKLQSEARVVPHYKNQKYEGFKLVGVRPGSLYRAIGIRSGDVIKSVNGTAIDSPNKAIELFEQLKNSSNIKVDIERRGQAKTLGYAIK